MEWTPESRTQYVLDWFQQNVPVPETELKYENGFQLLVAVILSAQCTDVRVNAVTPALFAAYPDAEHLAAASYADVFPLLRSVSYPNNKAEHIVGTAKMLIADFGGEIPHTVDELQKLPGVGRKTANVVASVLYDVPAIAVDTHVFRVANRLGLTEAKNPLQSEKQLVALIPEEQQARAHHWLILHGRYICKARRPLCENCKLTAACQYFDEYTDTDTLVLE